MAVGDPTEVLWESKGLGHDPNFSTQHLFHLQGDLELLGYHGGYCTDSGGQCAALFVLER